MSVQLHTARASALPILGCKARRRPDKRDRQGNDTRVIFMFFSASEQIIPVRCLPALIKTISYERMLSFQETVTIRFVSCGFSRTAPGTNHLSC